MGRVAEIEAEIAEAQARIADLRAKASALRVQLDFRLKQVVADGIARLNAEAREIDKALGEWSLLRFGAWSDPRWRDYEGATDPEQVGFAFLGYAPEKQTLPGEQAVQRLPFGVSLLDARGAVILLCTPETRPIARAIMDSIVLRCALAMPGDVDFRFVNPKLTRAFPVRDLLERRESGRTLNDDLDATIRDIDRIQRNIVRGAERFSALDPQERGGQRFDLICAVDFPHAYARDPRLIDQLLLIANAGPTAGRHLLLEVDVTEPLPRDFSLDRFENAVVLDVGRLSFALDPVPDIEEQRRLIKESQRDRGRKSSGSWDALIKPPAFFAENSAVRVETKLGQQPLIWFGRNDAGKEISHAMIAGQTGSGKSMLLHTLITGLATRYSPEELRLSLVDLKKGAEFNVYKNLPHADVVCLNAPPVLALSVLSEFEQEMNDRLALFGTGGAGSNLQEYRQVPSRKMPRKLMIVDEYQNLLESDLEGAQRSLENIIRQGRAAGMHMVLASQQFDVRGLTAAAVANVQALISLPLSHSAQQSLTLFGPEGKRLIRTLEKAQVVVNLSSGKDDDNTTGAVARLQRGDEAPADTLTAIVGEIVAEWRSRRGSHDADRVAVLNGSDIATLEDNDAVKEWRDAPPSEDVLNERARLAIRQGGFGAERWSPADRALPLWLGRRFDIRGHALAALRRAPSENLLAVGAETEKRLLMLGSALAALSAMRPASGLDLVLLDGLQAGYPGAGILQAAGEFLARRGARVEVAGPGAAEAALSGLLARGGEGGHRLLVVSEPEYLDDLHVGSGAFGPPPEGAARSLRQILQTGPAKSLHTVLTCSSLGVLRTVLRPATELTAFNHRVVQQMSSDDSMGLFGGQEATRIKRQSAEHPMGAMLVNMIEGARAGLIFQSYGASMENGFSPEEKAKPRYDRDAFVETLNRIFG